MKVEVKVNDLNLNLIMHKFVDIGANLTDPVFRGMYRGKRKHIDDLASVLQRARAAGVRSMIITGGSLSESQSALKLADEYGMFATAGCHPTRSGEFDQFKDGPQGYLEALDKFIAENANGTGRIVAIGECGLDYDRLHFASQETQKTHFRSQLSLAKKHDLPLFLHSRAAHDDFTSILVEEGFAKDARGVVHSFTGSLHEAKQYMAMGFYIGINGCSLKTPENLEVLKEIPIGRMMFETDAPWCSMTSTQASRIHLSSIPENLKELYFPSSVKPESFSEGKVVKGRNEPCAIGGVAWVVSQIQGEPYDQVVATVYENTVRLFGLDKKL